MNYCFQMKVDPKGPKLLFCASAKNLYGMKHIQHHHPNSLLVNWLSCSLP